ncbi:MAG: ABC transporter ATP-binding protein [Pseudomonadales bacterium]
MTDAYFDDENFGDEFADAEGSVNLRIWRQLLNYALAYPRDLSVLAVCAIVVALCEISFPLVTKDVVDGVFLSGEDYPLAQAGWLYFALCVALGGAVLGFIWFGGKLRAHISHDIRQEGFKNLQRLPFEYYDFRPVGWLMARMTSDCERLSNILAWGILDLFWSLTIMLGVIIAMLIMEWRLALLILTTIPALVLISRYFQKRILKSARLVRKTNSRITGSYNENIMGVLTSKVFVKEADNLRRFGGLTDTMHGASIQNAVQAAVYLPIVITLGSLATGLALVMGGIESLWGWITTGTLIAFLTYTRHFFEPIEQLAHWFAELQMAQASAERILSLINEVPSIKDSEAVQARLAQAPAANLAADGGQLDIQQVTFDQVSFRYATGLPVLKNIDLSLNRGQSLAIVGATGGGKTTLVNLLARFYEPTSGRILIDGVDYRERSLHFLQSNLGVVLQNSHIFAGTVRDNIRYGKLSASDQEIHAAAKSAGAADMIAQLEAGYDTLIEEGGTSLSSGQKQLIAFARALLRDPQILIMDEATSSVDTLTEQRIEIGLRALLKDRISVIIAHRLSTIRNADQICVLDQGEIIEMGSHEALIQQKGKYFQLFMQQSLSNLWEQTA